MPPPYKDSLYDSEQHFISLIRVRKCYFFFFKSQTLNGDKHGGRIFRLMRHE